MHDKNSRIIRRKGALGAITLGMIAGILFMGLAPFNPIESNVTHFPTDDVPSFHFHLLYPNDVRWLKNEDGLEFGDYGSIFSSGDFQPVASQGTGACSFEIWFQPGETEDSNVILAFYTPQNPLQLRVGQQGDALLVDQDFPVEAGRVKTVSVAIGHVFQHDRKLLVTVTSGPSGAAVYLNGSLAKTSPELKITPARFSGRLVIGNSPLGNDTWDGRMRGLAFFSRELRPEEVPEHYKLWASNGSFDEREKTSLVALYTFDERAGNVVHNRAGGEPDLHIPDRFVILRQPFLALPWQEFEPTWAYLEDIVLNIVGFVPLGLFLCAYLSSVRFVKRPALMTVIVGGILSLTIEVLQAFLPLRHSGLTDVFTNTSGAAIGALLFSWNQVQRLFERFGFI